jgi:pimeloyl-ACP methyl ester carboxylesterase
VTSAMPARQAILLPGTGSDEVFVRSVFDGPLRAIGIEAHAPAPPPGGQLVDGYLAELDAFAATARGAFLVGGISLGAHLATEWAARDPGRCAGVLAALPAWTGTAPHAPAAVAAGISADLVQHRGLEAALTVATTDIAPWLAGELRRAWRRHGDGLVASLRVAAAHPAPDRDALAGLDLPVGIAACVDDPVHPVAAAWEWAAALPKACVRETTLDALGAERASLGRAAVQAWLATGG